MCVFDVMSLKCNPHQGQHCILHCLSGSPTACVCVIWCVTHVKLCRGQAADLLICVCLSVFVYVMHVKPSVKKCHCGVFWVLCLRCLCFCVDVCDLVCTVSVFSRPVVPIQCWQMSNWMSSVVTELCTLIRLWVCLYLYRSVTVVVASRVYTAASEVCCSVCVR